MKVVISNKDGNAYQTEIPEDRARIMTGMKIGDPLDGGVVGAPGYKLEITGGSDSCGFPMRHDVKGARRLRILISGAPGFRPTDRGERQRKVVRGNTIGEGIAQLNVKVVE
ncbi:MAG: 30S ribosomal protein S6e, partial [Candidatus Micrarchaeota archaeon]|nr:30S ribosomal protein S6e [Candidatus Micrarchaeota archaeon]